MRFALTIALALACAPAAAAPRNPLDALRLQDLAATRERPLFAPSRRPPPPVPVEAPAPPAPEEKAAVETEPPFDLIGAVVGENARWALLRERAGAKVLRLRPGDDAGGWRVDAIEARAVTLKRGGRATVLSLSTAAVPATTPAPEVAGAAPRERER